MSILYVHSVMERVKMNSFLDTHILMTMYTLLETYISVDTLSTEPSSFSNDGTTIELTSLTGL